ncbi:MAG: methyltransferase [Flavobacteriales bacterium]|nr:methyltransferase [Flavobacteriales bacterium]
MDFLPEPILNYSRKFSSPQNKVLKELERETQYKILMPRMISGHLMGSFLQLISTIIKPKYILEIGTYTGYSAICLASGLQEEGELHTIEINQELEDFASKYFKNAKLDNKIKMHIGNAKDIIPNLTHTFDIIFIDADKKNYCLYYEMALQKIKRGGYIIIDNVLWSGKVLEKAKKNDLETKEIQKLNQKIATDARVENLLIPLRDGIMICKVL